MKNAFKQMKISLFCIAISSLSLICVSFADFGGNAFQRISAYVTGIVFWAFLITGYVLLYKVSQIRKQDENVKNLNKRPGIICFFTSKEATIADLGMLVVILITLILLFVPVVNTVVQIIVIALLVLSVQLHCILNGVNYRYIGKSMKKSRTKESKV